MENLSRELRAAIISCPVAVTDFVAVGDLNADGRDEVAALVSENYGGSGVFVFLAVYANVNGTLTFQTSTMVDDRPQLNALSIENGEIFLDAVIHGPDEPMCCPTLRTTRHYRLVDNQLDMTDYTTFTPDGKPRTITIESPANGTEVFSSVPIKGNVAIAPFENNLAYRIYDVSGIELSAGPLPSLRRSRRAGHVRCRDPIGQSFVRRDDPDRSAGCQRGGWFIAGNGFGGIGCKINVL